MIEALLIAAAEPAMTAIDAERAFPADAQKMGQWSRLPKWQSGRTAVGPLKLPYGTAAIGKP